MPLPIASFSFLILHCLAILAHQNKEIIPNDTSTHRTWQNYIRRISTDPFLQAIYTLQDEHLLRGAIRNRKSSLPLRVSELKPIAGNVIGRITEGRWQEKQAIELDQNSIVLPPTGLEGYEFTVTAWIRQNGQGSIKGKNYEHASSLLALSDGVWNGWRLDLLSPSNRLVFQLADSKGKPTIGVCGSLRIPPKTWTHIAISRNNSRIQLYINGLLAGEKKHDIAPKTKLHTHNLKVGYAGNGFSSALLQIDQLTIWSRAIAPYSVLEDSLQTIYRDTTIEHNFNKASAAFAEQRYDSAFETYRTCLIEELPPSFACAIEFRLAELHAILGNREKAKNVLKSIFDRPNVPSAIRSHALHDLLLIEESIRNPEESELSHFTITNSSLYEELSPATNNYQNAIIEYDFRL